MPSPLRQLFNPPNHQLPAIRFKAWSASFAQASSAKKVEMRSKAYGLDKPLDVQLLLYVRNILTGDFGYSFTTNNPFYPLSLTASRRHCN